MNNNVTFFASGSNHSGEIHALSLVPGANCGVVAEYVYAPKYPMARAELARFAQTGRKVFIDSGAFAEVKFNVPERQGENKGQLPRPELPIGCPFIVKPLTDKHWKKCFAVYADQALVHGANVFVVAPDCVAHQTESLERLTKYAAEMQHIKSLGATVLVPIQKGELSMGEFHKRASAILGFDFRPSIPMKKDATKLNELAQFCRDVNPASIHLLGIAPDTEEGQAAIATVLNIAPGCDVSCDACLIKRWVGKANGKVDPETGVKQPRKLTQLNDTFTEVLALDEEGTGEIEVHVRKLMALFNAACGYWMDLGLTGEQVPTVQLPDDITADCAEQPWLTSFVMAVYAQDGGEDGPNARQGTLNCLTLATLAMNQELETAEAREAELLDIEAERHAYLCAAE